MFTAGGDCLGAMARMSGVCQFPGRERPGHDAHRHRDRAQRHPRHRPLGGAQADRHVEFKEDNLTDWAAALTYYAVLALFPALLVLVALLGMLRPVPADDQRAARHRRPGSARASARRHASGRRSRASSRARAAPAPCWASASLGALWSASGYIGAFMRASNVDLRGRGGPAVLEAAPAAGRGDAGHGAAAGARARSRSSSPARWPRRSATQLGLGDTAVTVWDDREVAGAAARRDHDDRAALLRCARTCRQPRLPLDDARAASSRVVMWIVASAAFALLRRQLRLLQQDLRQARRRRSSFLVWLWISNLAVLFGAGAQRRARARARARGGAAGRARAPARAPRRTQGSRGQGRRGFARRSLPPRRRGRGTPRARVARAMARIHSSCSRGP